MSSEMGPSTFSNIMPNFEGWYCTYYKYFLTQNNDVNILKSLNTLFSKTPCIFLRNDFWMIMEKNRRQVFSFFFI